MKWKISAFIFILLFFVQINAQNNNTCIECHSAIHEDLVNSYINKDIHYKKGLFCNDCHGGDPTSEDQDIAMSKEKGFIGKPDKSQIPSLCNKCHGDIEFMRNYNPKMRVDQYLEYLTSVHGKRLKQGDKKVATCIDCHSVHNILNVDNQLSPVYPKNVAKTCGKCHSDKDYMKEYNIPTNQKDLYMKSIHAKMLYEEDDLSAPTCNDCHGNHGAVPPGLRSISEVCGVCHTKEESLFTKGTHAKIFMNIKKPECVTCHSNHLIKRYSTENLVDINKSPCIKCHKENDDGYKDVVAISDGIKKYVRKLNEVKDNLIAKAQTKGLMVEDIVYKLKDAEDFLVKAKSNIHTMDSKYVLEELKKGEKIINNSRNAVIALLKEYKTRKIGLLISEIFLFIFAISLYLYNKERMKTRKIKQ